MDKFMGLAFPLEVDSATGRIKTVEQDEAVRQSIKTIITTNPGERLMRYGFGSDLNSFLFDTIDASLIMKMNDRVSNALKLWEENIEKLDISIVPSVEKDSEVRIEVNYKTKFINEEQSLHILNKLAL